SLSFFLSLLLPPPSPTPFPYTTLFRSHDVLEPGHQIFEALAHIFSSFVSSTRSVSSPSESRRWTRSPGAICDARKITRRSSVVRSEEHTSELQSRGHLVCRLLLEKKKK